MENLVNIFDGAKMKKPLKKYFGRVSISHLWETFSLSLLSPKVIFSQLVFTLTSAKNSASSSSVHSYVQL